MGPNVLKTDANRIILVNNNDNGNDNDTTFMDKFKETNRICTIYVYTYMILGHNSQQILHLYLCLYINFATTYGKFGVRGSYLVRVWLISSPSLL